MGYTIRALKELQNDPLNINSEKVEFPHTGFNTVYTVYTVYIQFIRRTYMYTKIPYTVLANPTNMVKRRRTQRREADISYMQVKGSQLKWNIE